MDELNPEVEVVVGGDEGAVTEEVTHTAPAPTTTDEADVAAEGEMDADEVSAPVAEEAAA